MRILVAGGAGFIGAALCEKLLGLGHAVVCLDSLQTGSAQAVSRLQAFASFTFLRQDIAQPLDAGQLGPLDQIYNLACPASPTQYQQDPVKTIETNVVGTRNLLNLARLTGARFLLASTSEVYGSPQQKPQREDYWGNVNTTGPRSCYDEGKRCAEALVHAYHTQYEVDTRIARIFNTYGPGMQRDDGRVVSNFVTRILDGEPIEIYGDGRQTRCFCYVDDMVEALIALMASGCATPVNLGADREVSVVELAHLIGRVLQKRVTVHHAPALRDDPRERQPDLEKCRRVLGWQATTPLESGLLKTAEYFAQLQAHCHA
ncbi:UDP-glucuronate decarboxylase [Cupriavidus gilardii J11]|uniref:UDP-glucuronate decarboxylase n=1 Tax=Cupriavidus gilardii J11 TaxID=936133 RepID=A0A562BFZ1_9BURK|nr:NAD-dependent epimerase/dehydratase family protein [Cupriavidus gilardii]TWG84085.1 UDP-glucuronate decarboxylase [Cupriavidus gilardii J11]